MLVVRVGVVHNIPLLTDKTLQLMREGVGVDNGRQVLLLGLLMVDLVVVAMVVIIMELLELILLVVVVEVLVVEHLQQKDLELTVVQE
jgi:hypothetical protein